MKEAIIITGGAGYIGSITSKILKKDGWNVIIVDNLSTGRIENIKDEVFYKSDYVKSDWLEDAMIKYKPIMVMHFAASALVNESMENPWKYYENNVIKFVTFLQNIVKKGIKKLIFSSSAAVYGEPEKIPIKEEYKLNPKNVYGHTKKIAEEILYYYNQIYNLNYISLRYFNAAGAAIEFNLGEYHKKETHLIPNILLNLLGKNEKFKLFGDNYPTPDGSCLRDFVHVLDIAQAHLLAANFLMKNDISDIFNIGNEKGFSIKEVIKAAEEITRKKVNMEISDRRKGDPSILIADAGKIKTYLKWQTEHSSLKEIIESQWNFLLNNKNLIFDQEDENGEEIF